VLWVKRNCEATGKGGDTWVKDRFLSLLQNMQEALTHIDTTNKNVGKILHESNHILVRGRHTILEKNGAIAIHLKKNETATTKTRPTGQGTRPS